MKAISFLMCAGLLLSATPALATPRVDAREESQAQRIDEGVKSGELTRREARKLRQEQARIRRMERRAKADGKVGRRERAKIERAQDRASRRIAHEKHDVQER